MTDFRDLPFNPTPKNAPDKGPRYVYADEVVLAVNVALAADRVLLIRGAPGTGKSTLASDVAKRLGYTFLSTTITSRTEARDLLWSFDNVRRLNDAYARAVDSAVDVSKRQNYVDKGILWRAFEEIGDCAGAVVLIDEIDKADPDVPNDLLVPLDRNAFEVPPLDNLVVRLPPGKKILVMVTTNGERDLPQAFLRRCIPITLKRPTDTKLLEELARAHFGGHKHFAEVLPLVLAAYAKHGEAAGSSLRAPATAEFLDALGAGLSVRDKRPDLDLTPFFDAALWKHPPSDKRP